MDTVGIRELKAHLSRHLKRVRGGARLLVTERGRGIAMINPVDTVNAPPEVDSVHKMVVEGRVQWAGGKPRGSVRRVTLTSGPALSDTVLEDRR